MHARTRRLFIGWALGGLLATPGLRADAAPVATNDAGWIRPMRQVHARFAGRPETFAQFGDSITVTMAYWAPLEYARKNASPEMEAAFARVKAHMRPECWRGWKGPDYGSEGGMTIRWADENVDRWLEKLKPETVLIMFGTNDLRAMELDEYRNTLRKVARTCLDRGSVVILSTIPPRTAMEEKAAAFSEAVRQVAGELKCPLVDLHAEILKRRPTDWDGSSAAFQEHKDYDVPTLLARDGIHLSHPARFQDDYSKDALDRCGYMLRNYLVLMRYAEVIDRVLKAAPSAASRAADDLKTPGSSPGASFPAWLQPAPPLPPPSGEVVRIKTVQALLDAVERARPGQTILLADGHYAIPRVFDIHADGVTLRGESGRRDRVILDGGEHGLGELLTLSRCANVTVADLTIQNVRWNGLKLNSETGVQQARIYNCVFHNIWQRAVKGVMVPPEDREKLRPRNCRIEHCLFYNDRAKRFSDDPADTAANFNGDYVGGIDVMFAQGWTIRDNVFSSIQGRTRQGRGAVFLWHDARDCTVERNVIVDCDTGIALGNSHRPEGITLHASNMIVRNNFITRTPEAGVVADYTKDCRILHNTIHDPDSRLGRLIRVVHAADGLLVEGNLLSGADVRLETDSQVQVRNNLARNLAAAFADAAKGDLHLPKRVEGVTDAGRPLPDVTDDIDGQRREARPDLGADEFTATPSEAPG